MNTPQDPEEETKTKRPARESELERAIIQMPPLVHWDRSAGEFDPMQSEVAAWMVQQPAVRNFLFSLVKERGYIRFANGNWVGNPRGGGERAAPASVGANGWSAKWPPEHLALACLDDDAAITLGQWRTRLGKLQHPTGHWAAVHLSKALIRRGKVIKTEEGYSLAPVSDEPEQPSIAPAEPPVVDV